IKSSGKVGLVRVVLSAREHICQLRVQDRGFVMTTLHYSAELKEPQPYFADIADTKINKNQLKLAQQLVKSDTAPLDMSQFSDRYQDALRAMIEAKIEGTEPVESPEPEPGQIINLMDALKRSVSQSAGKKPPAKSIKRPAARPRKAKRA